MTTGGPNLGEYIHSTITTMQCPLALACCQFCTLTSRQPCCGQVAGSRDPLALMVSLHQYLSRQFGTLITLLIKVQHKRVNLLSHPMVHHFLNSKWNTYGLLLYIMQLVAYLFLIIPLSFLLIPNSSNCGSKLNLSLMLLYIYSTCSCRLLCW